MSRNCVAAIKPQSFSSMDSSSTRKGYMEMSREEDMNEHKDFKVELTVNGKEVDMNPFVKTVFAKVTVSLVESLKNTGEPEEVVVKVSQ